MSKLIWSHSISPDVEVSEKEFDVYSPSLVVKNIKEFEGKRKDLVKLPDRKAYRSMSRAGVLLSAVGLEAQETLAPFLTADSFSVGIYCAVENGPENYDCAKKLLGVSAEDFSEIYKKSRNPKDYLAQLPNLAPAQLGTFLGVNGPINTYTHSEFSCLHALEQAESDLNNDFIDCALVCSAFSLEDGLLSLRSQRSRPAKILSEGAAAVILTKSESRRDWSSEIKESAIGVNYGVTTGLMKIINKGE